MLIRIVLLKNNIVFIFKFLCLLVKKIIENYKKVRVNRRLFKSYYIKFDILAIIFPDRQISMK